jgi:transketolase
MANPAAGEVAISRFARIDPDTPRPQALARLGEIARAIRRRDIVMIANAGLGHVGGDMSVIDILVTLYFAVMNYDPSRPGDPERDRLVLSKGHASGALYTTMAALGLLEDADLATYMEPGSKLNGHPDRNKVAGVEANTGPLGHGLPIAVGMALSAHLDSSPRRTFVIVGDGELQEGSNWEALMAGAQYRLGRLTVIVDRNGLQQGASTAATNDLEPLADKAAAFGWRVAEVDGHDYGGLLDVLGTPPPALAQPLFVIAHTVKGHPISFMSGQVGWHHRVPNPEQVAQALADLEER